MSKRLAPVPDGQPERGAPPVIVDEAGTVPQPPPPPPPQPESQVRGVDGADAAVQTAPASADKPPEPPDVTQSDVEEVVRVLADPSKITRDGVDDAYRSLARRKALAEVEVKRMDLGLARLLDIAATTKSTRLNCFGQFDPGAPYCTQTCRDPVCPSYTDLTRAGRLATLKPILEAQVERMGETAESFGKHLPSEVERGSGLADGSKVTVDR